MGGHNKGVGSPGTRVTNSCELPCGCWELNPGPLQEQQVFLTTEPSLQPLFQDLIPTMIMNSVFF